MGITKSNIYTAEQNKIAALAKAIAHPARIAILQHLLKSKSCICGDLVIEIGLAQATVSQHLKEMKNSGLIIGNIEGTKVCYCINPTIYNLYRETFNNLFLTKHLESSNCC